MNTKKYTTLLLVSAAMLSGGFGTAFAESGQSTLPNTFFTELPGVVAKPANVGSAITHQQGGQSTTSYVANQSSGTWLFPPNPAGNG